MPDPGFSVSPPHDPPYPTYTVAPDSPESPQTQPRTCSQLDSSGGDSSKQNPLAPALQGHTAARVGNLPLITCQQFPIWSCLLPCQVCSSTVRRCRSAVWGLLFKEGPERALITTDTWLGIWQGPWNHQKTHDIYTPPHHLHLRQMESHWMPKSTPKSLKTHAGPVPKSDPETASAPKGSKP